MPATNAHSNELLAGLLLQLIVIIVAARLFGRAAAYFRQPRVVGEMLAGLVLGPSVFGHFFPAAAAAVFAAAATPSINLLSQFGLLLLMFQIGCDFEIKQLGERATRRAVIYVAVASISIPLLVGLLMGRLSADVLAADSAMVPYSLYTGVAFAVTAVPVLGRILDEYGLARSTPGMVAMSAALANDVVGWILLALISAYVSAGPAPGFPLLHLAALAVSVAMLWAVGRLLVPWLMRRFPIDSDVMPAGMMSGVLALIFAAGLLAANLGAFSIFGGFVVGLMFRPYRSFVSAWQRSIGQFVLVFFLPVFFMNTGLHTDVGSLATGAEWLWCGAFLLTAICSKILPVYFAARFSGLANQSAAMIAVMMNARGLMELIVLNIGLSLGFIPRNVYTMLVIMAIGTTVLTGPLLRCLLQKEAGTGFARADRHPG